MVANVREVDSRIVELDAGSCRDDVVRVFFCDSEATKNANSPRPLVPSGMRMCRSRMPVPR